MKNLKIRRVGGVMIAAGFVAWLVGIIGANVDSGNDGANIGAGLLQLLGYALLAIGAIVVIGGMILARGRRGT